MMFWLGLVIALISGMAGIGLSRDSVKSRFPWVRDFHLDWVAIVLLICALFVSAFDHLATVRQVVFLEETSHRVRSFEINLDIQFKSTWKSNPPQSPCVWLLDSSPVAKADLALRVGYVQTVELYMDKEPSFGPSDDGWVHTTFRVRADPGSWIIGSDARDLTEIRKLTFVAYGVRLQDSRDGSFTIGAKSRVFINGRQAALIEIKPEKAALNQLPLGDRNPKMSFNGYWELQTE
jgi:hypothetical protein